MIFHETRLLADDFNVISYLIFGEMSQKLSSAAEVIGAVRVKHTSALCMQDNFACFCRLLTDF